LSIKNGFYNDLLYLSLKSTLQRELPTQLWFDLLILIEKLVIVTLTMRFKAYSQMIHLKMAGLMAASLLYINDARKLL